MDNQRADTYSIDQGHVRNALDFHDIMNSVLAFCSEKGAKRLSSVLRGLLRLASLFCVFNRISSRGASGEVFFNRTRQTVVLDQTGGVNRKFDHHVEVQNPLLRLRLALFSRRH